MHTRNLVLGTHRARDEALGQRDARGIAAPPFCLAAARKVDAHGTHHASSPSHEVHAILQTKPSRGSKSEVGLVHERRGVERGVPARGMQAPARQLLKVVIRRGEQRIRCTPVAFLRTMNQFRQAAAIGHRAVRVRLIMVQDEAIANRCPVFRPIALLRGTARRRPNHDGHPRVVPSAF